jgi:hypothetical protein
MKPAYWRRTLRTGCLARIRYGHVNAHCIFMWVRRREGLFPSLSIARAYLMSAAILFQCLTFLHSALLCCAVLCCAALCRVVLCCAVLCCALLHCVVLCCSVLCCSFLPPVELSSIDWHLTLSYPPHFLTALHLYSYLYLFRLQRSGETKRSTQGSACRR